MIHLNFAKPRFKIFQSQGKADNFFKWTVPCCAFFVTRSLLRIITHVHLSGACVNKHMRGAKKLWSDFLGFRKSTFRPFSKSSSSDGFYPIGSKFGTKMAKHVISKTLSPIFDFRPETRDIPTRVKKWRCILQTLAFKKEYLPNATKHQNSETIFFR